MGRVVLLPIRKRPIVREIEPTFPTSLIIKPTPEKDSICCQAARMTYEKWLKPFYGREISSGVAFIGICADRSTTLVLEEHNDFQLSLRLPTELVK